jgi:hypothetical protein
MSEAPWTAAALLSGSLLVNARCKNCYFLYQQSMIEALKEKGFAIP